MSSRKTAKRLEQYANSQVSIAVSAGLGLIPSSVGSLLQNLNEAFVMRGQQIVQKRQNEIQSLLAPLVGPINNDISDEDFDRFVDVANHLVPGYITSSSKEKREALAAVLVLAARKLSGNAECSWDDLGEAARLCLSITGVQLHILHFSTQLTRTTDFPIENEQVFFVYEDKARVLTRDEAGLPACLGNLSTFLPGVTKEALEGICRQLLGLGLLADADEDRFLAAQVFYYPTAMTHWLLSLLASIGNGESIT